MFVALSAVQADLPVSAITLEEAKFHVAETKKNERKCPSLYAHAMMFLAIQYYYDGFPKKADRIFRKSVPIARKSQFIDEGDLMAHLTMWVELLAEGRDYGGVKEPDFERTANAMKKVLAEGEHLKDQNQKREYYLKAVEIFDKTEKFHLRDEYKKLVLPFAEGIENNLNADKNDVNLAMGIFNKLAEIEFPSGPIKEMPDHIAAIEPDSNTSSKLTQSKFLTAEGYKLQAAKLADRLSPSDYAIYQHRHLVFWYTLFGKKDKAKQLNVSCS